MPMPESRFLTPRECSTILAALRLWQETPAQLIPERCYEEVAPADLISDDDVEVLLNELVDIRMRIFGPRVRELTTSELAIHSGGDRRRRGGDAALERVGEPAMVVLEPLAALQLAGLIQLALRHPGVGDAHRLVGAGLIEAIREYFATCPEVLDILRRGDDPSQDV